MDFREFINETTDSDVLATLRKLPPAHRKLVSGWKFRFQPEPTLRGDDRHVGCLDPKLKTITVASPYHYGREFSILHEIGHLVWEKVLDTATRQRWQALATRTKAKDTPEESFCMAYANFYATNEIGVHTNPAWKKFVSGLPK